MKLERRRKLIDIRILDRATKKSNILFHDSNFPNECRKKDVLEYNIKVTVYDISNSGSTGLTPKYIEISALKLPEKLLGFRKVKLEFSAYNFPIEDFSNFKFNPKFNWSLVF